MWLPQVVTFVKLSFIILFISLGINLYEDAKNSKFLRISFYLSFITCITNDSENHRAVKQAKIVENNTVILKILFLQRGIISALRVMVSELKASVFYKWCVLGLTSVQIVKK